MFSGIDKSIKSSVELTIENPLAQAKRDLVSIPASDVVTDGDSWDDIDSWEH